MGVNETMCILYCRVDPEDKNKIVLVHVRDEDPDRPTLPPVLTRPALKVSDRTPNGGEETGAEEEEREHFRELREKMGPIVCGLDVVAEGTWMGVNRATGMLVALTNVRNTGYAVPEGCQSRGELVKSLLGSKLEEMVRSCGVDPENAPGWGEEGVDPRVEVPLGAAYAGFNILMADVYNPELGAYTLTNVSRSRLLPFTGTVALLAKTGGASLGGGSKSVAFSNGVMGDAWLKVDWMASEIDAILDALPEGEEGLEALIPAIEPVLRTQNGFSPDQIREAEVDVDKTFVSEEEEYLLRGNVFAAPGKVPDQKTVTRSFAIVAAAKWKWMYAFAETYPLPEGNDAAPLAWSHAIWPIHRNVPFRPQVFFQVSDLEAGVPAAFGRCFFTAMGVEDPSTVRTVSATVALAPGEQTKVLMIPEEAGREMDEAQSWPAPFGSEGEERYDGIPVGHYAGPIMSHAPKECHLDTLAPHVLNASRVALCASVLVMDAEGRVLATRRRDGPIFPRKWVFPGGRVDPGETLRQAALREAEEETGLDLSSDPSLVEALTPLCVWESHLFTLEKVYAIVYFVLRLSTCPPLSECTFQAKEVSQAVWIPPEWFPVVLDDADVEGRIGSELEVSGVVVEDGEVVEGRVSCEQLRFLEWEGGHEELAFGHKFALSHL